VVSAVGIAWALAGLLGMPFAPAALPLGVPGLALTLAPDALSWFFLLILCIAATAASVFAISRPAAPRTLVPFPLFIAAMALTLLAGDAFTLLLGFEAMSVASWLLVLAEDREDANREAARQYLGFAAFSGICLIGAMFLLAHAGPSGVPALSFAALRAAPVEGWRGVAVLVLVLLGAGSKAGLVPLHGWLPRAHPAAPSHVSALMSGAMTKVALYVIIRVLFDLAGGPHPRWWGVPLLAMGAASAVLGGLRANTAPDMKSALACSTIEHVGLIAVGLGLALIARAADLPALAALALGAALLHALNHGVFKTLLFLCAGAVQQSAGSRMLDRLGGLIRRMPVTAACALMGAAALAALPPGPGFASEWLLFQALLAGLRTGGVPVQMLLAVIAALMALAVGLAAAAAVRLIGIAFLGRPRSPRAAAAEDAPLPARAAMAGLAGLCLVLGLLPGPVLQMIDPALRHLLGAGMGERAGWLVLSAQAGTAGYAALGIALLMALAGLGALWAARRFAVSGHRVAPAWGGGFMAPPPWLPFGDPATQPSAAGFSQPLRRALGAPLLSARETVSVPPPASPDPARHVAREADLLDAWLLAPLARLRDRAAGSADRLQFLTIRRSLAVMVGVLVVFLALLALLEEL